MESIYSKIEQIVAAAVAKYDCVILPEFGAFVSRYVSAEINRSSNIILPPSKNISFNVHLKHNDGLLAGILAKELSVSYEDALDTLKNYTKNITDTIQTEKRIELKDLGVLFINNAQLLQFEPYAESAHGQYNFGFTPIILQALQAKPYLSETKAPIYREDKVYAEPTVVPQINKPVNLKRVKRNYLSLGILIPVVAALCYVSVKTVEKPNWDLAGIFGNFKSNTKNTSVQNTPVVPSYSPSNSKIDLMAYAELNTTDASLNEKYFNLLTPEKTFLITSDVERSTTIKKLEGAEIVMPVKSSEVSDASSTKTIDVASATKLIKSTEISEARHTTKNNTSATIKKFNTLNSTGSFSIIVGCFTENENAEKLVRKLKSNSISALLDGQNDKGMTMVSAGKFTTKEEATQFLEALKTQNIKAWIKH
jgi:cell division septation protein DedD